MAAEHVHELAGHGTRVPPGRAARTAAREHRGMAEWIYFIHAPRENFAATMTDEEATVWSAHFERLQRLTNEGVMILVGPTLGPVNTGVAIFEADDEAAARRIMEEDPAIASGIGRGVATVPRVAPAGPRLSGRQRQARYCSAIAAMSVMIRPSSKSFGV